MLHEYDRLLDIGSQHEVRIDLLYSSSYYQK